MTGPWRVDHLPTGHTRNGEPVWYATEAEAVAEDRDWYADCDEHNVSTCCTDWELALEAAYGHAAMAHPRVCAHEYGWYPMDQPEEHQCLDCGEPLPMGERT